MYLNYITVCKMLSPFIYQSESGECSICLPHLLLLNNVLKTGWIKSIYCHKKDCYAILFCPLSVLTSSVWIKWPTSTEIVSEFHSSRFKLSVAWRRKLTMIKNVTASFIFNDYFCFYYIIAFTVHLHIWHF